MLSSKIALLISVIIIVLFSCTKSVSFRLEGRLDYNALRALTHENLKQDETIIVSSSGGEVLSALKIAEILQDRNISIIVPSVCISACVEFLLPAVNKITFSNSPIIGIHWGPIMDFYQYKRVLEEPELCNFPTFDFQQDLFAKRGLNIDFWKQTEQRLHLLRFRLDKSSLDKCPWKIRKFENYMWLPTSKQLRELWGLKFSGSVCADDFTKCSRQVDSRWQAGTRIVIGDAVYVSEGKPQ